MVAAASEEASTNVQSVASATEEMASSVNEISRQVQDSARMAGDAVDQARKTNDRVGELSKAAARIGDVVELINNIAGQTNLLAVNASSAVTPWRAFFFPAALSAPCSRTPPPRWSCARASETGRRRSRCPNSRLRRASAVRRPDQARPGCAAPRSVRGLRAPSRPTR